MRVWFALGTACGADVRTHRLRLGVRLKRPVGATRFLAPAVAAVTLLAAPSALAGPPPVAARAYVVENGATGIYNATGPAKKLGIGEMLNTIKRTENAKANLTWVSADFLEAQKVSPWSDMPVWVPSGGEDAGMSQVSVQRAVDKDLTFRPLADTARDTLAWFKSQPQDRQSKLRAGLAPEREAEVLAAWKKKKA